MNPYLVLCVPRDANDARIRQAYLDALKLAPPETAPDRFKEIAAAYDEIRDEPRRLRFELFDATCPGSTPLDAFLRHLRRAPRPAPLPFEAMKQLLRSCAKQ